MPPVPINDCDGVAFYPRPIVRPHVMVVEGQDDCAFFRHLCQSIGVEGIQIITTKGKDSWNSKLPAITSQSTFKTLPAKSLCIIRDADDSINETFQEICSDLRLCKINPPTEPFQVITNREITGSDLKIAVMIMSDGVTRGEIEDVCLRALNTETSYRPTMVCVEQFYQSLNQNHIITPRHNLSKLRMGAYRASLVKVTSLGATVENGDIPLENNTFDQIKNCIRQLHT